MTPTDNNFDLQRFVDAQQAIYGRVLAELRAASKVTHWMWFIFPQIAGLGSSDTARHFALSRADEACAYLHHPLLGARLRECTALVNAAPPNATADVIFGFPDNLKFRSSMTLFHAVAPGEPTFQRALERFFAGEPDTRTLQLLARSGPG